MLGYKTVSLADRVYEELENRILIGVYPAGDVITEKQLAEELKVSRTPVREALSRLYHDNLIKDTANGTVVVGVSKEDAEDLFEIKRRLEPLIVRKVAENIEPKELEMLREIVEKQEFYSQKEDVEKVRDLDTDFHDTLYAACGSISLETVMSTVHHKLLKYRKASLEHHDRIFKSVAEHGALLSAIEMGDGEAAEAAILRHINNASGRL